MKSNDSVNLVGAVVVLIATGICPGCDRSEQILEPGAQSLEVHSSFPEFFLEKGTDADSSYISLQGVRKSGGILELQATSWGIVETGLFLSRVSSPGSAILVFMGECGTVPSRTWEKVTLHRDLAAADQDTLWRLVFTSHFDTIEVAKTTILIDGANQAGDRVHR